MIALVDAKLVGMVCNKKVDPNVWVEPLKTAMIAWGIDEVREIASFLANAAHESTGFTRLEENMNYSAGRLMEVWPRRFPNLTVARQYANNPEKLANFTYASRLGNGPSQSGDGWRFRGQGIFQLTGRRNYEACAQELGVSIETLLAFIITPLGAAITAGWYWHENGLDHEAMTPGVEDDRKAIQGGTLGVPEVRASFNALIDELLRRGA